MPDEFTLRQYDARDASPVWDLHEWAMQAAGTDPADVPGTEDLERIEAAYLDGGDFLVGVWHGADIDPERPLPQTFDGPLVAMGGLLPWEAGHEDERTVAGAAELHRMRVAPPLQGRGYGRELLAALETRAVELGFDLLLATTAARQEAATRFYPAAGYEAVDQSTMGEYELRHFQKDL
jgi:GNAT superfamily N-acetyltransferase